MRGGSLLRRVVDQVTPPDHHVKRAFIDNHRFQVSEDVVKNLESGFGSSKSEDEILAVGMDHVRFAARRVYLQRVLQHRVRKNQKWWRISGTRHLDAALKNGRGVILVSAHFGHVKLAAPALRAAGNPVRLVRALGIDRDSGRRRWWFGADRTFGDIRAGLDIRPLLSALSANQVLLLLGDGMRSSDFVEAPLLNTRFPLSPGFAKIARMTQATLLPLFTIEVDSQTPVHIKIEEPIPLESAPNPASTTLQFGRSLNKHLNEFPHLWHRWSIPDLFMNAKGWTCSDDRWSNSFHEWCLRQSAADARGE